MKNILFPIDLYQSPHQALEKALAFLQGFEGCLTIFLLKTYLVPASASNQIIDAHDEWQNRSLKELEKELQAAKELSSDGKVLFEGIVQMGRPANVIVRIVKERNIDCIIFESADNSPTQEETMNLARRLSCPVVILPTKELP